MVSAASFGVSDQEPGLLGSFALVVLTTPLAGGRTEHHANQTRLTARRVRPRSLRRRAMLQTESLARNEEWRTKATVSDHDRPAVVRIRNELLASQPPTR